MQRKVILWIAVICLIMSLAAIGISAYQGTVRIECVYYQINISITKSLRIVHLADLHSRIFGEDNASLIDLVAQQEPDIIFMTGDMLSDSDDGPQIVCSLISELLEIAPVYYGYGNHEKEWQERTDELLC